MFNNQRVLEMIKNVLYCRCRKLYEFLKTEILVLIVSSIVFPLSLEVANLYYIIVYMHMHIKSTVFRKLVIIEEMLLYAGCRTCS